MDQAEEWRHLRDFYARISDGELEELARRAYDLKDVARPLLKDEIARRGLKIPLATDRSEPREAPRPVDPGELVSAGTYFDAADAGTVADYLRHYGIPCFWGPEKVQNHEMVDFSEGVDLMVRKEDFEGASLALQQLFTEFKPKVPEEWDQGLNCTCPKCHSEEIVLHEVDETTRKFQWSCDACGYEWNDDGVEQKA